VFILSCLVNPRQNLGLNALYSKELQKVKTITSAQQKGGVGKTTTLVNLAYYLNELSTVSNRSRKSYYSI